MTTGSIKNPTTGRTDRLRIVSLVAFAALFLALLFGAASGTARAHDVLESSSPKDGESLTTMPREFEITTREPLLNVDGKGAGFGLQVTDRAGAFYGDGCLKIAGPTMSTAAALGAAGRYTLTWQAVSADGHSISDSFDFDWSPAAGQPLTPGSKTVPNCGGTVPAQTAPTPGSNGPAPASAPKTVAPNTLITVLWVGGGLLALAAAAILTAAAIGRKKRQP